MRVCVIGAGAAGLTTAKHLVEEGFEVEVLEKRDGLGGLWYFGKKDVGVSSNTHATSSKTFLQFSDFPMGEETDHFPHHTKYVEYLTNYAQNNNIAHLIKLNHEVVHMKKAGDGWEITVNSGDETYTDMVDAVAVCSGLHHQPLMLDELPGNDQYEGHKIHSSLLKDMDDLKGKRVVIVGGGESAADIAHELCSSASETYLSLRKGVAVLKKWGLADLPADYDSTRAKVWLPREFLHDLNVSCRYKDQYSAFKTVYTLIGLPVFLAMMAISYKKAVKTLEVLFDGRTWMALFKKQARHGPASGIELSKACDAICAEPPKNEAEVNSKALQVKRTMEWYSGTTHNNQPFTKSPDFLKDVAKGDIKIVPGLSRYNGGLDVEFEGGTHVDLDAIVLCTGFQSLLPFLEQPKLDGRKLYKNVFVPGEPTLAFIGFARPNIGAMPPIAEMQARWFAQVLGGHQQLPSAEVMSKVAEMDEQNYTQSRPLHAQRLSSLVDYHCYLNEVAGYVGCQPQLSKLIFRPKWFFAVLFGPFASFQYRVHGPGANEKAVEAAISEIPPLPWDRVLQHSVVYFLMKPWFVLLSKLGLDRFRPVF